MAIRTTVDIPESLHAALRHRAAQSGTSMRALIIRALEDTYSNKKRKGAYVTGPMIKGKPGAKVGPLFPKDENPQELVFS
jgi:hypothetical protein